MNNQCQQCRSVDLFPRLSSGALPLAINGSTPARKGRHNVLLVVEPIGSSGQVLAAVDGMAEQMRARDRAMVGILQQYSYRVFTEILTPVQVRPQRFVPPPLTHNMLACKAVCPL